MRPCRGPDRPQDRRQRGRREAAADARIFFEYTGLRPSMPRDVIGTLMSAPHLVPVASQPTATNRPETVAPTVPTRDATPPNRDVPVAAGGEFRPLRLGPLRVWPPVVLAPMAGGTNYPFRTLSREFGAGLYVSEMITARGFVPPIGGADGAHPGAGHTPMVRRAIAATGDPQRLRSRDARGCSWRWWRPPPTPPGQAFAMRLRAAGATR